MYNAAIESFVKDVGKFSASKFILYENKLSKLLNNISANGAVCDLIERCLKDFDFEVEFRRTMNGRMTLSNKAEKVIALVFCILVEVESKKIDFYKFLTTYFSASEINLSFAKFIEEMIVPFKDSVIALAEGDKQPIEQPKKEEVQKEMEPVVDAFATDMLNKLRNIALSMNKCEMAMPIFDAMKWAISEGNRALFQSLAYSLLFIPKNRKFRKIAKIIYNQQYEPKA